MTRFAVLALVLLAHPAHTNDLRDALAPTGTLRATYIATNPVQAFVDPATKEVRGPAAEITREMARQAGVPFTVTGARGVEGVIESVKSGQADIGFLAFDPVRAREVDFSAVYSLAQNTYLVRDASPIRSVTDVDRPGVRVGVGARDAGDYFLTRTLKAAELKRNEGGVSERDRAIAARRRARGLRGQPHAAERCRAAHAGPASGAGQFLRRRAGRDRAQGRGRPA